MRKVDESWVMRLDEVADGEGFSVPQGVPSVIRNGLVRPSLTPAGFFALRTGFAPSEQDLALLRSLTGTGVWARQRWSFNSDGLVLEAPGSVMSRFRECRLCAGGYRGSHVVAYRATAGGLKLVEELDARFGPGWWREEGRWFPDRLEEVRVVGAATEEGRSADELRNGGSGETGDEISTCGSEENEAGDDGDRGEQEENNREAAVLKEVGEVGDPRQEAAGEQQCEGPSEVREGGEDAGCGPAGVGHAVQGLIGSAAAVGVVIGAIVLFPPERGALRVALMLVGYPAMVALFYVSYSRWGRWLGAPPRLFEAGLGFAVVSWLLLFSGDAGGQRLAFWLGQTAVLLSGVSLGGGLAVISVGRGVGLAGAIGAAMGAKGGRLVETGTRGKRS